MATPAIPSRGPIPNRGPQVATVTILFLALTWIVVVLRIYVRTRIVKRFFLDDWLVTFCQVLFTVYSGYGLAGVHWGTGRHVYDIPPQNIKSSMMVWYFCELFYCITAATLRVTVGVFLLHFAARKLHRSIIIALNTVGILYNVIYGFAIVYQCVPLSYFWERFEMPPKQGTCFNPNLGVKLTLGATVIAAVTDWVFGLLPIWIMWDLRMNSRKKFVVCLLLGLGALASTAPIVRLPYIAGLLVTTDFLWATTDIAIWSVVELGVGIVVISIPSLRPLVRSIPWFAALSKGSSNNNNHNINNNMVAHPKRTTDALASPASGGYRSDFNFKELESDKSYLSSDSGRGGGGMRDLEGGEMHGYGIAKTMSLRNDSV